MSNRISSGMQSTKHQVGGDVDNHNKKMKMDSEAAPSGVLRWQDRPEKLKSLIYSAFESLWRAGSSCWGLYNGAKSYEMLTISECICMKTIIQQAPQEQKEFYVLDIGAGNFQLINHIVEYINEQKDIRSDITVHVIGVRGEGGSGVQKSIGKCKLYELTAFKIENIFDEFVKIGFSLENKLNFVISRWCFRHLADPLGTFVQVYNLLRPKTGILILDGFYSLNKNQETTELWKPSVSNGAMIDIMVRTKAPFLMQNYNDARSLNRFILQRHDESPCQLYMSYLENFETRDPDIPYACIGSNCITRFDKGTELANIDYFQYPGGEYNPSTISYFPGLFGDQILYDWLKNNHIIDTNKLPHLQGY